MDKEKPLTLRKKLFCENYLALGCKAKEAAVAAGFSESRGSQLLSEPGVKDYIQLLNKDLTNECIQQSIAQTKARIASKNELQEFWTRIMYGEIEQDENSKRISFSDRIKASEMLGKSMGIFIEKRQITGDEGGPISLKVIFEE